MTDNQRREIYWNHTAQYARQQELLAAWKGKGASAPIVKANKGLILAFQEHLLAKGTGQYRIAKILGHLRIICQEQPTLCLPKGTKEALRATIAHIMTRKGWGAHSRADYTRVLKHLYRWYEDEDPRLMDVDAPTREDIEQRKEARQLYSYLNKHVKVAKPRKVIGADEIITEEDLQKALRNGCRTPLERAFIAVLHNSGARIGEMLNIRIRDYERRGKHALLRLDGKTGERRAPILQAIPYLEEWLRTHPDRENPSAWLWVSMSERHYGKPLAYLGARKLLRRTLERAGVQKRMNAHHHRHSRISISSKEFSQAMLCQMMGWKQGSAQAQTYIHLGARDVEDSFLKVHGILPQEQHRPTVQYCACGETNTADARYCYKCGQPLSVSVALQEQEYLRRALEVLPKILEDPSLKSQYERRLQELRTS